MSDERPPVGGAAGDDDDAQVKLIGESDVVDEPAAADEQRRVLQAGYGPAEDATATLRVGFS